MPRRALSAAVLAALCLAACGGSSHSSSSAASTTTAASSAPTSTATAAATATTTATTTATSTISAGPTTTTATTSSRPPEVPKNKAPKHSKPTAPNTDVRLPAAFVIRAGGAVTPPGISAPANVTIELQLRNVDAAPHRVTLSVPHFGAVAVPAHGRTTTDVNGVPKGTYTLSVDGTRRARIVVGAVPGP